MHKIIINSFGTGSDETDYQPYDINLPEVFKSLQALILDAIPGVSVDHIGSSSIPEVGGRNVIDIAIPTTGENNDIIKMKIKNLGFEDSPFPHYLPLLVGSILIKGKQYFILLYIISPENQIYKDWISFRDYMRTNSKDAKEYDRIKKKAIEEGNINGDSYQKIKSPFIQKIISKIQN